MPNRMKRSDNPHWVGCSVQLGIQSRISKGGTATVPHPHFTRVSMKEEVYAEDNPLAAFARLFGQGSTMTTGAPPWVRFPERIVVCPSTLQTVISRHKCQRFTRLAGFVLASVC